MGKFDGILICTDLDGTLIGSDRNISRENIEAIEYFKSEGGYFTFVTGRMPFFVERMYNAIKPNVPFGCINGGGLYDFPNQKYIWMGEMGDGVNELIRMIDEQFPKVGIQVNTFYKTYFSKENEIMWWFRKGTGVPNLVKAYDDIDEPVAKIIFGVDNEEDIRAVEKCLRAHPLADNFDFVRSEETLFEILPKGIGKGVSITKLVELLGIDRKKTVSIGDYNNDISMFRASNISVAVANASEDAKAAAKYITVSNNEHAIARLIKDIEDGKYEF